VLRSAQPRASWNAACIVFPRIMRSIFKREFLSKSPSFFSWWIALTVLWMAFIGQWKPQEFWAGVLASAISTTAGVVLGSQRIAWFAFNPNLLKEVWRIPGYVISGTWEILRGLAQQLFSPRRPPSLLRVARYFATEDSHTAATQRALAITYTTATPNSLILNIERKKGLILYHQILPSGLHVMTRKLGAGK
jgi:hypothetical protein